jgi:hypothetical protein
MTYELIAGLSVGLNDDRIIRISDGFHSVSLGDKVRVTVRHHLATEGDVGEVVQMYSPKSGANCIVVYWEKARVRALMKVDELEVFIPGEVTIH